MNYANILKFDVANGPGVRTTLFVSGCTHNCKGCFNVEQQSFDYGKIWSKETEYLFLSYLSNPMVVGVSILGGEPMQQTMDDSLYGLLKKIKEETGKEIWLWTGYLYEDLVRNPEQLRILEYVDVLIDGQFKESSKDLNLKYRGSSNQRIIDVQWSLMHQEVIELKKYY